MFVSEGKDFPLVIEPETEFSFPEHLKVFTYEMASDLTEFPEPKRCETGKHFQDKVFGYFIPKYRNITTDIGSDSTDTTDNITR